MGLLSGIKKLGRAIDPTSSKSALGGITRTAIGAIPGGSAALGAVEGVNAARRATSRSSGTARTAAGSPAEQAPGAPGGVAAPSGFAAFMAKPGVIVAGLGAALLLVVLLVVRRK